MSDSVWPHRQQATRLPRLWDSPGPNPGVGRHFFLQCMKVKSESEVAQVCLTLSDPMGCSLLGSSIPGIFQARVLEWGAIVFSDSLTLGVIKYLNRNRQKWWGGWSLSEINGSYECKVSNCNWKNVEGQKKRLKIDLQKVGIKQNLKKSQRIQGGWRKENWIEWESGYAQRMFQEVREGHGAER